LSLSWFFLEGVLPFVVLAAPALFTFKELLLAACAVAMTLLVRGALHLKLRYSLLGVVLHPVWVAAVTGIFAWSTFVNGVLGRNEWRGRVRDAGTLEF